MSISTAIRAPTTRCWRNAPADALERIAPDRLARRHAEVQASIARLAGDIAAAKLDALIVVGDDQEELFDQSNMPAIGIYYGETIRNAGQASIAGDDWMARARRRYLEPAAPVEHPCHPVLARHLIAALQQDGFDISVMRGVPEGKYEGHAYSYVHRFCMADGVVPIVPVFLNAYFPPNQPTPARCFALGEALAARGRRVPGGSARRHHGIRRAEPFRGGRGVRPRLARCAAPQGRGVLPHRAAGEAAVRQLGDPQLDLPGGGAGTLDVAWDSYAPGYRTPALTGTGLAFASLR